jgi:putative transposase
MPNHLQCCQGSGDLHFITFSCHDRRPYLCAPEAIGIFECSLEQIRRRYVLCVYGYVVMPEHVHLLVSEPKRSTLDIALQGLKTSVSKQCAQRPFWLLRYYDFNVFSEEKRIKELKYMHRNPVNRGLAHSPSDWKWSSFRHYMTGETGVVEIESAWAAGRREGLVLPEGGRDHASV